MSQNLQNFVKFQKFQLENLVDFEKCSKTHIFLQKSVPIQSKTSNILPKFCRSAVASPTGAMQIGGVTSAAPPRPRTTASFLAACAFFSRRGGSWDKILKDIRKNGLKTTEKASNFSKCMRFCSFLICSG